MNQIDLLVLQPTAFCNLDCSYCYLPDRSNRRKMELDLVRVIFEKVFSHNRASMRVSVVWHAGEPLVVPINFYRKAFDIIETLRPSTFVVRHSFQTNATLLDDDWCKFIAEHNVNVGVSIDGPQDLHDLRRRDRRGRGTFEQTMAGIKSLQRANIPIHVISVLTRESILQADNMFEFYVKNDLRRIGFNVEEIESFNKGSSLDYDGVEYHFREFFDRILFLNGIYGEPLTFREVNNAVDIIRSKKSSKARSEAIPLKILSVDQFGNCFTFSPELVGVRDDKWANFVIGNILQGDISSFAESNVFRKMEESINIGIDACKKHCNYYDVCGGGSPGNKYFENGSFESTETLYCRLSRQAIIDVVLDYIELQGRLGEFAKEDARV